MCTYSVKISQLLLGLQLNSETVSKSELSATAMTEAAAAAEAFVFADSVSDLKNLLDITYRAICENKHVRAK